jgi:hypothetical protein
MTRAAIWLLIALPVTRTEYDVRMAAADTPARSDYLARWDNPGLKEDLRRVYRDTQWRGQYQDNVTAPLQTLTCLARKLGCHVVRGAGVADLAAAAAEADVIIVYSHWKGAAFSAEDFIPDAADPSIPKGFLVDRDVRARLEGVDDPLAAWLRGQMSGRAGRMGFGRQAPLAPRRALERCLDAPIDERSDPRIAAVLELPTTTAARRRDKLDRWLGGLIHPGNRLELFDGMSGAGPLFAALDGFTGVLDLSACTTTYLGDRLGQMARHAFRTVQFVEPQTPVECAWRLGLTLRAATAELDDPSGGGAGGRGAVYLAARLAVAREIRAVVASQARQRGGRGR